MKKIIFIFALAFSFMANAQDTIEKTVGEFSTLKVYDLIHVKMVKSDQNKVIISGKHKNHIEVVNKNGKLKIRMDLAKSYDGIESVVTLYYTSVDIIDANEGANVKVVDPIEQFEIDLKTQEGAEITAILKTSYANFKSISGGVINVSGSAKTQDISINTGGIFKGSELVSEHSEVSINAAGEAHVNVTGLIEVRIKAGGDVYIHGDPKQIDESRVFGGRIKRM